jgi:hypothetical protein
MSFPNGKLLTPEPGPVSGPGEVLPCTLSLCLAAGPFGPKVKNDGSGQKCRKKNLFELIPDGTEKRGAQSFSLKE